jgi:hypothetical protein
VKSYPSGGKPNNGHTADINKFTEKIGAQRSSKNIFYFFVFSYRYKGIGNKIDSTNKTKNTTHDLFTKILMIPSTGATKHNDNKT